MAKSARIPTQKCIALESGVSRSTVGEILNQGEGSKNYSEETRRRVLEAAARLGYVPNRAAQIMRKQRSDLVSIVHFGAGVEVAQKTNLALANQVNAAGYACLSMDLNWNRDSLRRMMEELIQSRVEGVIISNIQRIVTEEHLDVLRRAGIPVVSVFGEPRSRVSMVYDNIKMAIEQLTRHLIAVGHRRILQLTPGEIHLVGDCSRHRSHRVQGFRRAIEESGVWEMVTEDDFFRTWCKEQRSDKLFGSTVVQEDHLYDKLEHPVYNFCKRLFALGKLPDAVLCSNDMFAMEVFAAAAEMGVRIPADMAVTGYDNDRIGVFPAYGITTVAQDIEGAAKIAVETLAQRIKDPSKKIKKVVTDPVLIFRTSCGREKSSDGLR